MVTNLKLGDVKSPQIVKSIQDSKGYIINYFRISKNNYAPNRLKKSSGILIFKKKIIDKYKLLVVKKKEREEKVEQFRLLENKILVKSIYIKDIHPSVNTKKELLNLLSLVSKDKKEINIFNKINKIEN